MKLLFVGCSHLSGSWDDPMRVDLTTGIIQQLALTYPGHQFVVHAVPGHGLLTFLHLLDRIDTTGFDKIIMVGSYYRLSIPAVTDQPMVVRTHSENNFTICEYRRLQFYTIYPPNCIDPEPYAGDFRKFIVESDYAYMGRKTQLMIDLLPTKYPLVAWEGLWDAMYGAGIPVESYWSHPTDCHFTLEGNIIAMPFLKTQLEQLGVL